MNKEVFKDILTRIKKNEDTINLLHPYVDLTNVTDEYEQLISTLLNCYFGEEGYEWISWFLYEKRGREDMNAWDKDGNEICRNEDELWELCERERMTKKEYTLPVSMTDEERLEFIKNIFTQRIS
jgi:hypothetical protein